eukprot:gene5426-599_t
MSRNKHGQQSARRLPWAVPADDKKKGTTPQIGVGRRDLHYVGRKKPDCHIDLRFATWNIGTVVGRGMEVVMELVKEGCLYVVYKRNDGKMRVQGGDGTSGVGILLQEDLCDEVVKVRRIDKRLIVVVLMHGKQLIHAVSAYVPLTGRSDIEKDAFYAKIAEETELVGPNEFLIVAGDLNGHVGPRADGFEGIHGGFGIGTRNDGGRRLLEYCTEADLVVINTWFKKTNKAFSDQLEPIQK